MREMYMDEEYEEEKTSSLMRKQISACYHEGGWQERRESMKGDQLLQQRCLLN